MRTQNDAESSSFYQKEKSNGGITAKWRVVKGQKSTIEKWIFDRKLLKMIRLLQNESLIIAAIKEACH